MDWLRQYMYCLCATALFCSVVCELLRSASVYPLVRWICGLIMLLTLLRPLGGIRVWNWDGVLSYSQFQGDALVSQGERDGKNALASYISNQTSSYIESTAKSLGIEARVEVTVSYEDLPVPTAVRIYGSTNPYLKLSLEEWIQENIDIPKENVVWIG